MTFHSFHPRDWYAVYEDVYYALHGEWCGCGYIFDCDMMGTLDEATCDILDLIGQWQALRSVDRMVG